MTETTDQEKLRQQLKTLTENSYKQGFKDGQAAVAIVFEKLDGKNEEANSLYREIAKVIRGLQIIDDGKSVH